ncbi:type IV pilin biogenesis protein [Salmonella enterica subsp. enterica serovar Choleraesuis]|nr:type IV pilin biogenesis protein [Salmonella enterica subsp. enterica serovar Choleraesuis]
MLKLWQWKALDKDGNLQHGERLAITHHKLHLQLVTESLLPLEIGRNHRISSNCWQLREQILFLRQLAGLLQAGISLADGVALLAQQHPQPAWRALLLDIEARLLCGESFSQALEPYHTLFAPLTLALLRTGELTGKLDTCCNELALRLEQQRQLTDKVKKALRYPLFSLIFGLLVTGAMTGWVLPQFTAIYQSFNAPLPALTRIVISISNLAAAWGGPMLLLFIVIIMAGASWFRRSTALQYQWQSWMLKLPLVAPLLRGYRLSQLYTTLALTQQSGVPLLDGIALATETLPAPLWSQAISHIGQQIAAGSSLSQEMSNSTLFTPLCTMLMKVGEESGTMDTMLARLAQWHTAQVNEYADGLTALLQPLIMALVGGIVGVLLVAMYLPVFQLGDAMSLG